MRHIILSTLFALSATQSQTICNPQIDVTTPRIVVDMNRVDANGIGEKVGTITISESDKGLVFTPQLKGLQEGVHGFHIHEKPSCSPSRKNGKKTAAGSAGGHFDPDKTGKHEGPFGEGHKGDLPPLVINSKGKARMPTMAPRLKKLAEIKGRALIIHESGDNFSDEPKALGGGGPRLVCGVIR